MMGQVTDSVGGPEVFADKAAMEAAINEVSGHRNALDGRLVDICIHLLSHDDWKGEGLHRPEQYLTYRCGIGSPMAHRMVNIARRADELPASIDALRRGELSVDQLMPIVRKVPAWADTQVLSLAKRLTVHQIQRTVARYNFDWTDEPRYTTNPYTANPDTAGAASPDSDDDPGSDGGDESEPASTDRPEPDAQPSGRQHLDDDRPDPAPGDNRNGGGYCDHGDGGLAPKDSCWFGVGEDGRWRLHLDTGYDVGAIIETAIREARDALFNNDQPDVNDIDAITEMAQRSLDTIESPERRERFRTNVHLNTDGTFTNALGFDLPDAITDYMTCDGLLTPVFYENGVPFSVGRRQRIVPERTRKIVELRDGACRVPGCNCDSHLEIHHIIHWTNGGETSTYNLVALCAHHHRLHHRGRLGISGNADATDGLVFTNAAGRVLAESGARPKPPGAPPPPIIGTYNKPLAERLDMNWVAFVHPSRLDPRFRSNRN